MRKSSSRGTVSKLMKSVKSMQRAGGKVSRQMGIVMSEETRLALLKKKQDFEMAKQNTTGQKTQSKKAMEFIFCIINERELFEAVKKLIDSKVLAAGHSYQDL